MLSKLGPQADGILLKLSEKAPAEAWFALSKLLLVHHSPGFGAMLLRDFQIKVRIRVLDPGEPVRISSSGTDHPTGNEVVRAISGFPPLPTYHLFVPAFAPPDWSARPGAAILISGPTPVYYRRDVITDDAAALGFGKEEMSVSTDDRLRYVAAAAPGTPPIPAHELHTLVWADRESFDVEVKGILQEIRGRFTGVLQSLAAGGYMSASEVDRFSALEPSVSFDDQRALKTPLLSLPQ